MILRQLFDADSWTYTYLIGDEDSREAVIIDPVLEKASEVAMLAEQLGLTLIAALDTHTHADHVTALGKLRETTGCRSIMGAQAVAQCVNEKVSDGDIIRFGKSTVKAIYTPGHTDDSYSFLVDNCLFSGDTLLIRGTGRTDFQNGDSAAQYDSLFNKLLTLPDSTYVYPGHDYRGWTRSTIGEEKRFNPRLQVKNAKEYAAIMDNLNLPNPRLMDIAVPANQRCGKA